MAKQLHRYLKKYPTTLLFKILYMPLPQVEIVLLGELPVIKVSCYFFSSPIVHSHMHFLFSLPWLHACTMLRKISNINKMFMHLVVHLCYYFYKTWNICLPLHATNELWSVWSLRIKGLIIVFWVCVTSNPALRNIKKPGMGETFASPFSN